MQTFLPYPKFSASARVLDSRRLGDQRIDNYEIMSALLLNTGWVHHPVTKMWRGYEWALLHYQKAIVKEWVEVRGFKDSRMRRTFELYFALVPKEHNVVPPWLGDKAFHRSHQSNLVRMDPDHYGPLFPGVPNDLPYIYPVEE